MNKKELIIFISGNGSNLQAIIDACEDGTLNANIKCVVSNKSNAYGLERALKHNIRTELYMWNREHNRNIYDWTLAKRINEIGCDLIVLAGWMHLLGSEFLNNIKCPIINLHPALPGQFPGKDAIKQAWEAYKQGRIKSTGLMIHHVIEEMDAGEVIETCEIPINSWDTFDDLNERVRHHEKPTLIKAIQKLTTRYPLIYRGKVRDVYDLGNDFLCFHQTDRQSAFDRHICKIPHKGIILTSISAFWFNKTEHIIPNHMICWKDNTMICKKCTPFKVEVVVRGYITGSTSTSLWTHYNNGERVYCGVSFPDGLIKNQKLYKNVVTPTTKGEHDNPISGEDIIQMGLMTQQEWNYIHDKALELFDYGQKVSHTKGLILVDTKYEFGKDVNGNILLIDEIHTCDSSRYWLLKTYHEKMNKGDEPDKFDKDVIRDYIKSKCDPYNEKLPEIPQELINKVQQAYSKFYKMLTEDEP